MLKWNRCKQLHKFHAHTHRMIQQKISISEINSPLRDKKKNPECVHIMYSPTTCISSASSRDQLNPLKHCTTYSGIFFSIWLLLFHPPPPPHPRYTLNDCCWRVQSGAHRRTNLAIFGSSKLQEITRWDQWWTWRTSEITGRVEAAAGGCLPRPRPMEDSQPTKPKITPQTQSMQRPTPDVQ